MPRHEDNTVEQADRLDRFWDALILDEAGTPEDERLEPGIAETVRYLEAAGKAPGSTVARERVWRSLQEARPTSTQGNERGLAATADGKLSTTEEVPTASTSMRRLRRRLPLTELLAAAILLGLLGSSIAALSLEWKFSDLWRDPASPGIPVSRGGPARTGEQPGPGPGGVPGVGWQVETGAALSASPAIVDGVVYIGTYDRQLLALDADDGTERWSFETEGAIGGPTTVADGVVYVGDEAGMLYAVDADSGVERWRVDLGNSLYTAAPVVVNGVVYMSSGAGGTAPAVVDGVVYAGGDGSASRSALLVHAIDAATGEERWRHSVAANGLFALDAATGEEQWHFATFAPIYHSSPAVADGVAYVGSKDGHVYAVDIETGQERWRVKTGKAVYSSPAVVDGRVYIGSTDGFLYALEAATGQQYWRLEIGVVDRSSAAVADGVVYVVGGNYLWAVDATSGNPRWQVATGGDGEGSPTVIDGVVYVSGRVLIIGGEPEDGIAVLFALVADPGP